MSDQTPRNRAQTEARIIDAVEQILAREGYQALGVNRIAREAGVGKVLIYRYFGGIEGLLDAYSKLDRFWPGADEIRGMSEEDFLKLNLRERVRLIFRNVRVALRKRPHAVAIYAWEMAEKRDVSQQLVARRAQIALTLVRQMLRADTDADTDSGRWQEIAHESEVAALIAAGLLHLTIREHCSAPFAGMNLADDGVWERLEQAVDQIFAGLELQAQSAQA